MKPLPPLSPEVEALLEAHRSVLPLPPTLRTRALARAAATPSDAPPVHVGRSHRWAFAAALGAVAALGAAAYAGHGWVVSPSEPAPAPAQRDSAPAPRPKRSRPPVAAAQDPEILVPPSPQPLKEGKSAARIVSAGPSNAELRLLLVARQAVSREDFAGALAVIAEHTRRFRNGRLAEEREALRVRSLAGLGRHEEARRAAAHFHARFPNSVLLSTFERIKGPAR